MKKIKQLGTIAFLALALTFGSCSSDSDGGSTSGGGEGTISAKVDGKTVTTMKLGTYGTVASSGGYKILSLAGADATGKAYNFAVVGFTGKKTYDVNAGAESSAVLTYSITDMNNPQNVNNTWAAGGDDGSTGTITVTEYTDAMVKGTFEFKGVNQAGAFKEVKNGSFNVKLTQQGQ